MDRGNLRNMQSLIQKISGTDDGQRKSPKYVESYSKNKWY